MSPEEIQERKVDIKRLADKVLDAANSESHTMLLEALLTAFVTVAEAHGCCTQTAAYAAALTAERLQTAADAAAARPEGVPLH